MYGSNFKILISINCSYSIKYFNLYNNLSQFFSNKCIKEDICFVVVNLNKIINNVKTKKKINVINKIKTINKIQTIKTEINKIYNKNISSMSNKKNQSRNTLINNR